MVFLPAAEADALPEAAGADTYRLYSLKPTASKSTSDRPKFLNSLLDR